MDPLIPAISIVLLLFSVILHEVMHGYMALKFGDTTALRAGRLTLNPLPHIDPVGTILLPALILIPAVITGTPPGPLLAWAKPVPVNPLNFSNIRRGELFVSAAGILANFGLAVVFALIFRFLDWVPMSFPSYIEGILQYGVQINLLLAVFNLLPIPPLDGSKILLTQLPYSLAKEFVKLERYGFLILAFLIFIFPAPIFILLNFFVRLLSKFLLGF
jgi:Zn-dependent protease